MADDKKADDRIWELMASSLEPVTPPADLRQRLLSSVVEGAARFLPFAADLGRHFDLSRERVAELLSQIDDPRVWTRGADPIQGFFHFTPGPRLAGLHAGIIRMNPGAQVQQHRHVDPEITYVLDGAMRDDRGVRFGPGRSIEMAPGTEHALYVDGDVPALVALLNGDVQLLG